MSFIRWGVVIWDDQRLVRGVQGMVRQQLVNWGVIEQDAPPGAEDDLSPEQLALLQVKALEYHSQFWPQWQGAIDDRKRPPPGTYIWPDGRFGSAIPELLEGARASIEEWRDALDDEPLPLPGGDHAVASAQFEHWGGLFHRAQRHRADPGFLFRRIILPRVMAGSGAPAGLHEVASPSELLALADARLERHNAVHNARHIIAEEYVPLIDAVEEEYAATTWRVIDRASFTTAMDALLGYQLEARFRAEAELIRQVPVAVRIETAKAQAIHRLETEAAQRLTYLTGETHTWLALQQAATYDASGLIALVAEGREAIEQAETLVGVEEAARQAMALVKRWAFGLGIRTSHRVLSRARSIRLVIMGAGPAWLAVSLHRDAPGPGSGTTPIPKAGYSLSFPVARLGESVTTVSALITLGPDIPADADLSALIELRVVEDGPVALQHWEEIGAVPIPEPQPE